MKYIRTLLISLVFISIAVIFSILTIFSSNSDTVIIDGIEYQVVGIKVNGEKIGGMNALLVDGTTMVPFRAICEVLNTGEGTVSWNEKFLTSTYSSYLLQIRAGYGDYYIKANSRYFYNEAPITIINGTLYVPIRPMAKAFSAIVEWNGADKVANIITTGKSLTSGSSFYDQDDLFYLSRIINAESKFEPLKGKIAVGNVVLNRVASKHFPDTIEGVVFDRRNGVTQFTPVDYPVFYDTPTEESMIAAKIVLEGYSVSDDILYYLNIDLAGNFWIVESCTFVTKIGNHSFYS